MYSYVLMFCAGEYDDHEYFPVAVAPDLINAKIIQEAMEFKNPDFYSLIPEETRKLHGHCFSIDILEVPLLEI